MKSSENKKIRNATEVKTKGITFKSVLEKSFYNTLLQEEYISSCQVGVS